MNKVQKRTKIVGTLGPASTNKTTLTNMVALGVDVCRLNFSHGSQEDHQVAIETIREISEENQVPIAILADLQGPKIRIGKMKEGGALLLNGKTVTITTNELIGDEDNIYITYENFPNDVSENEIILLDDGKIQLRVISSNRQDTVVCEIVHGGVLTSRKGVNLPNTKISIPSLTEEDIDNLNFALSFDVEWVAMSFVRTAADIVLLGSISRARIKQHASLPRLKSLKPSPTSMKSLPSQTESW